MNKKFLYALWAGLFILCACCGFIPRTEGVLPLLFTIVSLLVFLPAGVLLWDAGKQRDLHTLKLIRNLSALSLGLTLVLLVLNFLTAMGSEFLGQVLHYTLVIVSSPMICSGNWAMSLFLWACLLTASVRQLKR